ncbi:hypothetical protein PanWU01x14_330220 [Parasponia andersonii]|uniref:Uncharacterized protein n=1 Tax=Parasponia andersonii TaxID=3476 RepID=A0A2P5AI69_PARAD|nr:hypothetical protein PanWU01x14_330220 [Parasponia andersonii]
MEKKKTRGSTDDESAVVKAAAWAWYQHGLGSDGNPTREYDITTRRRQAPRPSRYKLEAAAAKVAKGGGTSDHNIPFDQESRGANYNLSLLDAYEIRSISRHFDSLVEYSSSSADHKYDNNLCRKETLYGISIGVLRKKKMNMMKLMRGFWLRHAAAVCSTREDEVVDTKTRPGFREGRQRQRQENLLLPVVMAATCRPWSITQSTRKS